MCTRFGASKCARERRGPETSEQISPDELVGVGHNIPISTFSELQTLTTCEYWCVDQEYGSNGPQCPLPYCEGSCQCCNGCWVDGSIDPVENNLCPGVTCDATTTESPPTTATSGANVRGMIAFVGLLIPALMM